MKSEAIDIPKNKSDFDKINIQLPVLLISKDTTILEVNKSLKEVLEYTKEDLLNKSLLDITDPEDRTREVNNFIDIFYGKKNESLLVKRFIKKNNDTVQLQQLTFPIADEYDETRFAIIYLIPYKKEAPVVPEKLIQLISKLKSTKGLLDQNEFGSTYNEEVLNKIRNTIDKI